MRLCSVLKCHGMRSLTLGLTLVRHGETQYNKEGLLQGQAIDSALSETGLQQADAAGRYLRDVVFSNVFVSDMLRARQTAEEIMKHNSSCSSLQMLCDPLLKEKSFGIAEGGRVQDFKEMARAAGESFPDFTPPEGETPEQFHNTCSGSGIKVHVPPLSNNCRVFVITSIKKSPLQFLWEDAVWEGLELEVKQRVQTFLEKMLQLTGSQHWPDGGAVPAPPEPSPVVGMADDGVRAMPVHALVVTHGAYMRVAVRYFVEELHCCLPQGCDEAQMFSLSPNTGLCRFILSITKEGGRFILSGIRCVFIHRRDHMKQ